MVVRPEFKKSLFTQNPDLIQDLQNKKEREVHGRETQHIHFIVNLPWNKFRCWVNHLDCEVVNIKGRLSARFELGIN